jgi:hypothetical protein
MFVVGPIDWFVLKWTGRQPWTWVTTAGWAGLITLGAIFVGYAFKSGELHFRTTSIIDEADSMRVAATDIAAIYSPKTSEYDLQCDTEGWWHPASEFVGWSGGGGLKVDIPCHQDYHGNRPLPLRVNVWNLRFLEGTTLTTAPAVIEGKLAVKYDSKLKTRVVSGTITNLGSSPVTNVVVRLNDGVARVSPSIGAGQTAEVLAPVDTRDAMFAVAEQGTHYYSPWGRGDVGPTSQPSVSKIADLSSSRSVRVEKLLKQYRDVACVYAECAAAPETVKLQMPEAKRVHQQVIRSLVHLDRIDATTQPRIQVMPKAQ